MSSVNTATPEAQPACEATPQFEYCVEPMLDANNRSRIILRQFLDMNDDFEDSFILSEN